MSDNIQMNEGAVTHSVHGKQASRGQKKVVKTQGGHKAPKRDMNETERGEGAYQGLGHAKPMFGTYA